MNWKKGSPRFGLVVPPRAGPDLLLPETGYPGYDRPTPKEHGGSDMARANPSREEESFFSLPHAKWVAGVLSMLIAVVGMDSLLGLILRQTRSEIVSILRDEDPSLAGARF